MRVAQLGKSGVALSRIGLGGFELGPDDDKPPDVDRARAAIAAAMASGVNWIDTSENYIATANESLIGAALDGVEGEFLVSSKVAPEPAITGGATRPIASPSRTACGRSPIATAPPSPRSRSRGCSTSRVSAPRSPAAATAATSRRTRSRQNST